MKKIAGFVLYCAVAGFFAFLSVTSNYQLWGSGPGMSETAWKAASYKYLPVFANGAVNHYSSLVLGGFIFLLCALITLLSLVWMFGGDANGDANEKPAKK